MKTNQKNILLAAALILLVAIARIVTREFHLYNLAPVGALGLFTATIINDKRIAVAAPLLAMLLADLFFQAFTNFPGFYGQEQLFVYGGMMLVSALGLTMGKPSAVKVLGYTLGGSLVFFLVSNFGSFLSGMWGTGFAALVKTYTMAIPFYQKTLAGELIGATALFGAHHLLTRNSLKAATQRA
jgi:hypothetical protein